MTEPRTAQDEIAAFWADLGIQRGWMNEPVLMSDDPIWKMTAKEGYLFDDAFWEVFERHPFRICHVTYSGAPWSLEGGPPEMVLRFTLAEAAPEGGLPTNEDEYRDGGATEGGVSEPGDYEGYIDEAGDERQSRTIVPLRIRAYPTVTTPPEHRRAQQCSACQHVTCSRCGYVVPPNAQEQFRSHVCA